MKQGVGQRVKELRKELNLTQELFAQPLSVDRGHIAGIETGSRNPSEPLIKLMYFIYRVNETWLKTGQGEMFVSPEEVIANNISRFRSQPICEKQLEYTTKTPTQSIQYLINLHGEHVFFDALNTVMKEHGLAVASGRNTTRADSGDPELDHMINALYSLWTSSDVDMKGWIKIQFGRAFPKDMIEEAQKKQKEPHEQTFVG